MEDICALLKRDVLQLFTYHLNSIDVSINFTVEVVGYQNLITINMLYLTIPKFLTVFRQLASGRVNKRYYGFKVILPYKF